jgi:hypothetical protein
MKNMEKGEEKNVRKNVEEAEENNIVKNTEEGEEKNVNNTEEGEEKNVVKNAEEGEEKIVGKNAEFIRYTVGPARSPDFFVSSGARPCASSPEEHLSAEDKRSCQLT